MSESTPSSSGSARASAQGPRPGQRAAPVRCSFHASNAMLERNLAALSLLSPRAAAEIAHAQEPIGAHFDVAPDGGLTGTWITTGADSTPAAEQPPRRLASARAPIDEAHRWAQGVELGDDAVLVLCGFGLGHHVRALVHRVAGRCVLIVHEPDVSLLRAVLERHDLTDVFASGAFRLVCHDEPSAIAASIERCEGLVAAGTRLIDHPASQVRLGARGVAFSNTLAQVVMAVRTQVVTTLVQVETTVRNLLQNISWYATCPGIADLKDAAKQWGEWGEWGGDGRGVPAIVISAGPSLDRAMETLADPATRDRAVLIATQTVLGTLLARGIKPHFVVALDYHEISRRFYEGLTADAARGVTLVVEPKANPAILEAFPGAIRCVGDDVLDAVLGESLATPKGEIPPGATVAHLAYGLARFIGCDPVILVGQDLAFTDGQYYAHHAAIHRVWSNELNAFNTLEMLEWERIVRMRSMLRTAPAVGGGEVYTDEQMHTYRVQFEREFQRDAARGLTTIDASEGGAAKSHTSVLSLRDALDAHAKARVPSDLGAASTMDGAQRDAILSRVDARLRQVRIEAERVAGHCDTTRSVLEQMRESQRDQGQVEKLISQAQREARAMDAHRTGLALTQFLNQTGQLKRFKADRAIASDSELTPIERQRRQIDRDIMNAQWLRDAAMRTSELLDQSIRTLRNGPKVTRDLEEPDEVAITRERVTAVGVVTMVGPGAARADAPINSSTSALGATLARVSRASSVREVVILADDPTFAAAALEQARQQTAALGIAPLPTRVVALRDNTAARERLRRVAIARTVGPSCWRGAIANLTAWDEVLLARDTIAALDASAATARGPALCLGWNWCLVEPTLIDALVARHAENTRSHPLAFAPVSPGVSPILLSRDVLEELARASGPLASIGGMLGYVPAAPKVDPIAKGVCVGVPATLRDLAVRGILDDAGSTHADLVRSLIDTLGARWIDAKWIEASWMNDAGAAGEFTELAAKQPRPIEHAEIVLDDREEDPRRDEDPRTADALASSNAETALATAAERGELSTVTIRAAEALDAAAWAGLVSRARALSPRAVHVRTYLDGGEAEARAILAASPDIVSVDVVAATSDVYAQARQLGPGRDAAECFDASRAGIDALIAASRENWDASGGLPSPWIVPRITRGELVRGEIEGIFDAGVASCGWCVIDAPTANVPGRIRAIPVPAAARERMARTSVRVVVGMGVGAAADGDVGEASEAGGCV